MTTDSPTFEWTSAALEAYTSFSRLQARGTVRLALRQAGLEAGQVTADEMAVVLERILPKELAARNVADAARVCKDLLVGLRLARLSSDTGTVAGGAEAAFRRMFDGVGPKRP